MTYQRITRRARALARRFRENQRGNVLMILGLSIIPLSFAVGMGIDYSRAMKLQTRLNAAADAAALSAVTQTMMTQTNAQACTTARNMFQGQTSGLSGLVLNMADATQFKITLKDNSGVIDCASNNSSLNTAAAFGRTATVSYSARSQNAFGFILGMMTLPIHGSSQSYAAVAPDIDFYMMLDTSQSMLLPATTSGLNAMVNATLGQVDSYGNKGCAFACHQSETRPAQVTATNSSGIPTKWSDLSQDISSNPILPADASLPAPSNIHQDTRRRIDNYTIAKNLGIVLRADLLTEAISDLTSVAKTSAATNHATYRMGLTSFDYQFQKIWPTTGSTSSKSTYFVDSNLDNVKSHVADAQTPIYCLNNQRICGTGDNDQNTKFNAAFKGILGTMPTAAGDGTKTGSPQAILFLITDGMWDESRPGSNPEGPIYNKLSSGNYVKDTSSTPSLQFCTDVKARNIRIAILYTQYLPASASDNWSQTHVRDVSLLPTDLVAQALEKCASPGLYYKVTTDDDISGALAQLFQSAVSTARITQ